MTKLSSLLTEKEKLEKSLEEHRVVFREVEAKLKDVFDKLGKVQDEIAKIEFPENSTVQSVDWEKLLDGGTNSWKYKIRSRLLTELGFSGGSYSPATNQTVLSFSVEGTSSDEDLKKIQKNLKFMLPFLKPGAHGSKNLIHFSLFEHTLSQCGSYSVLFDPEIKEWSLVKTVYGLPQVLKTPKDLESLLKYIQKYHPKELEKDDED